MDRLEQLKYSPNALNIRHHFYDTEIIIYVEAKHDEMFWGIIFEKFAPNRKVILDGRDGVIGVKEKANLIERGELRAIAAMDADFSRLGKDLRENKLILLTHGYAIENSLIESCCIEGVFKYFKGAINRDTSLSWFVGLGENLRELLLVDIYGYLNGERGPFTSLELNRFTRGKKNTTLCPVKISDYLKAYDMRKVTRALEHKINSIPTSPLEVVSLIKGHFLLALARKFFWGDKRFDEETMYNLLLQSFDRCISSDHSHAEYYRGLVDQVFSELDSLK